MKLTLTITDEGVNSGSLILVNKEDGTAVLNPYRVGEREHIGRAMENVCRVVAIEWRRMKDIKNGYEEDDGA